MKFEDDYVIMSRKEYYEFAIDADKLARLEGAGVDNWQGYDDALHPYDGEQTFIEYKKQLREELGI